MARPAWGKVSPPSRAGTREARVKAPPIPLLTALADTLEAAPEWTEEALEPLVKGFCEAREVGLGKVAQPIRVSMTGQKTGPGLYEMLVAAGKPMALRRIRAGADRCPTPEA